MSACRAHPSQAHDQKNRSDDAARIDEGGHEDVPGEQVGCVDQRQPQLHAAKQKNHYAGDYV